MPPELGALLGTVTLIGAFVLLFPVAKALGERLRPRAGAGLERDELQRLRDDVLEEVQQVRREVAELSERVDFAERLLAKHGGTALPRPGA